MKRKKLGASLIMVITICSAILLTSTVLVTMTIGDYKLKQLQSNRIHNLYGADSGLDATYDVMVKDFDAAVKFANFKVEQLKAGKSEWSINNDKYKSLEDEDKNLESNNPDKDSKWYENERKRIQKNKDIVINSEFQRSFKLFLNSEWLVVGQSADSVSKTQPPEYIPNELKKLKDEFDDKISKKEDTNSIEYVKAINTPNDTDTNIRDSNIEHEIVEVKNNPTIKMEFSELNLQDDAVTVLLGEDANPDNYDYSRKQSVKIELTSIFETKEGQSGEKEVGPNKRTVKASYNLIIPNYGDMYSVEREYKPYVYDVYKDKAITVFGNMKADMGTDKLTISGDTYVFGDKDNLPGNEISSVEESDKNVSTEHITNKYKGGISLIGNSSQAQMEFDGNVITRGTFNIQHNVDVTVKKKNNEDSDKNLYALNVYAGKLNGVTGDNSSLNLENSMIIDNDLTVKSTATDINMKNFYGINDKHIPDNDKGSDDKFSQSRESSSIIVNTYKTTDVKPTSVNITDNAYIMGVAYIDTDIPYQTGESVGVKGNYKAYSEEVANDKDKYGNDLKFSFGINNPLYLINGKVNNNDTVEANVADKADHFVNYWNDAANKANLDNGGVKLPEDISKVYSAGAIVYKDKNGEVQVGGSNYDLNKTPATILQKQREYALNVYNLGQQVRDTSKTGKTQDELLDDLYQNPDNRETTINKFMALDNLTDDDQKNIIVNEGNKGVFNADSTKTIVIKKKSSPYAPQKNGEQDIFLDADDLEGKISAFIVTAGDVVIDGTIDFRGNIITEGNLLVQNSGDKTITYDEQVAQSIQRKVPDIFAKVFKLGSSKDDSTITSETSLKVDYDLNKFLKSLLWRIIP